jgi:hypothetical protein
MPPCSGPSLYPRPATHHRRLLITRHHQGFTVVHPSGLPLACSPRVEREPSGFFPGLHTPPLPAAHAGVGTGIVGTCLSYVTISWSSSQRSHSPRATSCRTDLIRASLARRQGRHAELVVGETTVRTHVTRILARLGAGDRVQAVVAAYESGLVQPGSA